MPSIKSNFTLKDSDIERIKKAILSCPNSVESIINDYLHNTGGNNLANRITRYIPKSEKGKRHAKTNKWFLQENYNLAVAISNSLKGKRGDSFYYLYYVITGTGTNKKKGIRDFMGQGLNKEYNPLVEGLLNKISEQIDKELKL